MCAIARPFYRLPSVLLFASLCLVSALYVWWQGYPSLLGIGVASAVVWGLLTWVSVRVTEPAPPADPPVSTGRGYLWLQIGVILLFAALANQPLPVWGQLADWLRAWGEQSLPVAWVGGPGNAVANPVQYFVIPFFVLLLFGVKPAELGLQGGYRTGRVCLVWLLLPLLVWIGLLVLGQLPIQTLARRLIGNALQNGFFEEFLFRGALQSRLTKVIAPSWALVVQALLFGLWHIEANLPLFSGDWWGALAWCIVAQAVIGLFFGLLFQRTRSLIAPAVAHVVSNAMGQTFG